MRLPPPRESDFSACDGDGLVEVARRPRLAALWDPPQNARRAPIWTRSSVAADPRLAEDVQARLES